MLDFAKPYIEIIERLASEKNEKIEMILIGGLAMGFYGMPRRTLDIDAEVHCEEKTFYALLERLKNENAAFNLSANISGWGIVPLPARYAERAPCVHEGTHVTVKILDPADFVFSKLMRGTEEDFSDALFVIKKYNITKEVLTERKKLVDFPKDTETLFFNKKFEHLLETM